MQVKPQGKKRFDFFLKKSSLALQPLHNPLIIYNKREQYIF
jgi:hypothetical protein